MSRGKGRQEKGTAQEIKGEKRSASEGKVKGTTNGEKRRALLPSERDLISRRAGGQNRNAAKQARMKSWGGGGVLTRKTVRKRDGTALSNQTPKVGGEARRVHMLGLEKDVPEKLHEKRQEKRSRTRGKKGRSHQ